MALTTQDLHAIAARIRPHFEPPLQDIAEGLALQIAKSAGARTKQLRPETTLDEILEWMSTDSLNRLELLMAIEEQLGIEIPDEHARRGSVTTFRQLVIRIARSKGVT